MIKNTKNPAKSTVAAAIAFALALGATTTPALAATDSAADDNKRVVSTQGMASDTAIEVARVYFGIDRTMVSCLSCVPCECGGRACYEVSFTVRSRLGPSAGYKDCRITSYLAYVDMQTGEVLGSRSY